MLTMRRFTTAAILFCTVLFVVLPLYELADSHEHWPNDGEYVSFVLSVLFLIGLSAFFRLVSSSALRRSISIVSIALKRLSEPTATGINVLAYHSIPEGTELPRFLLLREFRI